MIEVRLSNCLMGGTLQSWESDFQTYFVTRARQESHSLQPSLVVADPMAPKGHGFTSCCSASYRLTKYRKKSPTVFLNSEKWTGKTRGQTGGWARLTRT